MINETVLFLTHTDCGIPALKKHGLGIGPNTDFDSFFVQPLRKVFPKVIVYDMWKSYAEIGVGKANKAILNAVRSEHPKYVLWPSMMYEVLESTFQAIRQQGTLVVGWFFDDEVRFDDYSRRWIPYLDYCLTNDKERVKRYEELGATAIHVVLGSNPETFRKLDLPLLYDVTFVGRKFGDRGIWIEQLGTKGIKVLAFGRGWSKGYVSTEEMVKIFNASKINLCFVKSYGMNTRLQIKDRIFHVCMAGGFLMCEYFPGIEEFFEIDKEIVCFKDLEDATAKIQYYWAHEAERQTIAQAGWRRARRDHTQASRLLDAFSRIEENTKVTNHRAADGPTRLDVSARVRRLPSSYHLTWARGLMMEGYPRERWQEELDLALFYDRENKGARRLSMIGRFPAFVHPGLIRLWAVLRKLRRSLGSRLRTMPILRKTKQTLNKCRSLMEDMLWLIPQLIEFQNSPKEDRLSYHDHTKDPLGNRGYYAGLKDRLLAIGVPVEEVDIDVSDFGRWLDEFSEIKKHYQNMGDVFVEKCLEHYLAFRQLRISNDDVYIDIAASGSAWADILNKRGIRSYSLDLGYPEGIHGIDIGADAGNTKLPDRFCSVLSAQCAYECFMGDADVRFVREAARILNEKGRYGIVPLYLDDTYFVATSPYCNQRGIRIEGEARKVWRDDEYKEPFSRHYSPEYFKKRIYSSIPESMRGKILYFRNLTDVMKHYPGQRIYCFFMFYCEKADAISDSTVYC